MQTITTDVLVVGGGGAAARAAFEAGKAGVGVTLVTKGSFGAIGTRGCGATAGGFSAVGVFGTPGWKGHLTQMESAASHMIAAPLDQSYANILQAGLGMADPALARILVEEAVSNRLALLEIGASFGEAGIRSHGVPIMSALVSQIKKSGISVLDRTMVVKLISRGNECLGAIAVHELKEEPILIQAATTIIATGGDANLFVLNLNPSDNTGDGYVMGYDAGAELMNLEFKQIFIGTVFPTRNMITQYLSPEVRLLNAGNEEFLNNYLPPGVSVEECLSKRRGHNPFSTRDKISKYFDIAIVNEVRSGRGTEHCGVYLDRTDPRVPRLSGPANEFWEYRAIDFNLPVEIGVCHHCSLGGLRIDENARTSVSRLYAAGEVAAGPHGADRMGGHMLLASQVFGARAGKHAANASRKIKTSIIESNEVASALEKIQSFRNTRGNQNPAKVKNMLQRSAYFNLLTVRSEKSLKDFARDLKRISSDIIPQICITSPQDLIDALELDNLVQLGHIETEVCLKRAESRGPHYREDYPAQDDTNWLKSVVVRKVNDQIHLDTLSLDPSWHTRGDEKIGYWG